MQDLYHQPYHSVRTPSLDPCVGRSAHAEEGIPWSQEVLQEGGLHLPTLPLNPKPLNPRSLNPQTLNPQP